MPWSLSTSQILAEHRVGLLGLGRRWIRRTVPRRRGVAVRFGLADGGYALHVEFLVVGVTRDRVDFESLHKQHANADVSFFIRRQPDLVVYEGLLERETRTLL